MNYGTDISLEEFSLRAGIKIIGDFSKYFLYCLQAYHRDGWLG